MAFKFYVGLHQPSDAAHFDRACISINRLRTRGKPVACPEVLIDSGAFTELHLHGHYRHDVRDYARDLLRLVRDGVVTPAAAVAQDFMCEPFMLKRTGLSIPDHQRLTIERFDALADAIAGQVPLLPVLQGYAPADYGRHLDAYGDRLGVGAWVGIGSVCKRNGAPEQIVEVAWEVHRLRPDLRLHGFGVKRTALLHAGVRAMFATADSMAWSYSARKQGRSANDWREAEAFVRTVADASGRAAQAWQIPLPIEGAAPWH